MKHRHQKSTGFIVFILALLFMLDYSAAQDEFFKLHQTEKLSESVLQWHFFESGSMANSSHNLFILTDGVQKQQALTEDYLQTVYSKAGRYYAMVQMNPRETEAPVDRQMKITVYNEDNELLYTINRLHYYDRTLPVITISDKGGETVLGQSDSGELWFYNSDGTLKKQLELFNDSEYDLERILQVACSADGEYIVILATKRGSSPAGSTANIPNSEPQLILFNSEGNQIWQKSLPEFSASNLLYSKDGNKILVNNFTVHQTGNIVKKALVYDRDGKKLLEADQLYKRAGFSEDSNYLIMADNRQLRFYDLQEKTLLWKQQINRTEGIIVAVETSGNTEVSVVLTATNTWNGESFIFQKPIIKVFDKTGRLIQSLNYPERQFRNPGLWLSPDGNQLKVGFQDSYIEYISK